VNAIEPHRVTYEELVAHFEREMNRLFAALGSASKPPPRRMRRQSDRTSETMVLRFLHDHAARTP
jgi:LPS sulfotransferase NodH